ncbi:hypothetical protein EV421DRAFT_1988173 [Armillaria borealis]|uniref:C3H1-type domain-containing protein n=1 Tax=Armillaria borealis TaxID=47425 RepID=A0AA39J672_9AGAR|nr:hypothetical protein EV421DRAFT_1988173 [Armillaria borealis]
MTCDIDYYHTGNGVACWYYNHDTCMRGVNCEYSHAADIRSVRDSRGKNVCLHYLQGYCMFGEIPCRYSHDRRFLPPNLSHCPAPAPPPAVHIHLPPAPIIAEPIKPPKSPARMKLDMKRKKQRSKRRRAEAIARNRGLYSHYEWRQSGFEDERAENFGFLRGEAEELACQGVKPWDDDAWAVIDTLSSGL